MFKKRIMYFMDFPLSIGGANKVLLTQANIMQKIGHETLIVIPDNEEGIHIVEYDQICGEYGLRTIAARFPIATCMEEIDIMDALGKYDEVRPIIEAFSPDLIHSTQLNIAVELAARELGIPHLMNIYQTDEETFNINWLNAYPQYHSADSLLFSNRWSKGLGIPSRCIRVAYDTLENKRETHEWGKAKNISIITIGVLCERKNQMEIIKFVLRCKENGYLVNLTLLGNCENYYGEWCKKFVEVNGLQEEVCFAGFVLNIEDYLQKADLFILASTVESYPGVIVESMANRVPIISTAVAGVPELLIDGENGFLTTGYEDENLYEAFLRYLKYCESGEIPHIVEKAHRTYLEQHTYAVIGERLENYYQWIVEDFRNRKSPLPKLGEVRNEFESFIEEKKLDRTDQRLIRKLWLLYHVALIEEEKPDKRIAIWGAGVWGSITLEWILRLGMKKQFVGFIDSVKEGEYMGYPIGEDKDLLLDQCGVVLVAVAKLKDRLEIMNYLEKRGKVRNRDYFMILNSPIRI